MKQFTAVFCPVGFPPFARVISANGISHAWDLALSMTGDTTWKLLAVYPGVIK